MNKKIIGIIIVFSGLVLLTGVVYLLFFSRNYWPEWLDFSRKEKEAVVKVNDNLTSKTESAGASSTGAQEVKKIIFTEKTENKIKATKASKPEFSRQDLMRLAASFAERFGTYSNQSNFSNILGLKMFMNCQMKAWVDSYISEHRRAQIDNSIYYGIMTKAIGQEFKDYDDDLGRAAILVKTRRREASGNISNVSNTFSQDILIKFVKENGAWKVSSANWLE